MATQSLMQGVTLTQLRDALTPVRLPLTLPGSADAARAASWASAFAASSFFLSFFSFGGGALIA